jgi:hypothetical protein
VESRPVARRYRSGVGGMGDSLRCAARRSDDASQQMPLMRVYTYIVEHDLGFAPNPFHGVCSLACCKPNVRRHAVLGDYIIGTGTGPNKGRVVYWMRISEIITFDQYWADARFQRKRPVMRGSLLLRYGDNIYHHDPTGCYVQEDSFHSEPGGVLNAPNLTRDTATSDRVLLGRRFAYWGGDGPTVPAHFDEFVHRTQGHKCRFPAEKVAEFIDWLHGQPGRGCVGDPTDWPP